MFRSRSAGVVGVIASLLLGSLGARPAFAAADHRLSLYEGTSRAAFAGAVVRLEMGAAAKPPATRLQLGFRSVSDSRQSETPSRYTHVPLLELGFAGKERGNLFIAGQPADALQRRAELDGSAGATVAVVFGVALVAVGVLVITNLDSLGDDD